jgi:hypothetical protein
MIPNDSKDANCFSAIVFILLKGVYSMPIHFEAMLSVIESVTIIKIPPEISEQLPSRGMVMMKGTIHGISFPAALEPDGKGSHWFETNDRLQKEAGLQAGQIVSVTLEPTDDWIEPAIPDDITNALQKAGTIVQWNTLTTKARWEWLRWIRSTKNPATRQKRIDVACSKLQKGDRRPCCFDASRCSVPEVSKSGVLNI